MVSFLDHWDVLLDHGLGSYEDAESGQAAFQNPGFDLGSRKELFLFDFANREAHGISEERLAAAEPCR